MTSATASDYARRLVETTSRGYGDLDRAYHQIEQEYGIGRWQLAHLRSGKAKSCDMGLFMRVRSAYLDICERQVRKFQHELAIEEAKGGPDDDLANLEAEASALAAKIEAKKAAMRMRVRRTTDGD